MAAGFRTIVESLPRRVPAKASSWAAGCSCGYERSPVWKDRWLVGAVVSCVSAFRKKTVNYVACSAIQVLKELLKN